MTREVLEALPHGVVVLDAAGRATFVNRAAADRLGPGAAVDADALARDPRLEVTRAALPDGQTLLTLTDASARRAAEHDAANARHRLRVAFEDAPIGMVLLGITAENGGRILEANAAVAGLLGYSREELVGRTVAELTHPDDLDEGARRTSEQLTGSGGARAYHREKRFLRADGSVVWTLVSQTLVRDADGRAVYGIGQVHDVTDLKRSTEEQARLQGELDRARRLESIGQLAGGIAHDFNNLLGIVLNYAAFIAEELPEDGDLRADLDEIRRAAERGAELTGRLLVFSRQDLSEPEPVDAAELLEQVERLLRRTLGEHVLVETGCEAGLPPILADPAGLQQVLVNLAVNARDAMPEGGRLALSARALPDGELALEVRDSGCGMPADVVARAFDPFFTTKPVGKGSGLGLATSYAIVKRAGGRIDLESAPGEGTLVRVVLPAAATVAPAEPEPAPDAADLAGAVVLVVEDDDGVREVACRILTAAGCTVIATGDPTTAAALAREHHGHIDLLLSDMVMPGLSGLEVAEAVRAELPGVRVLFMSGYAEESEAIPMGQRVVPKPFTRAALLDHVAAELGRAAVAAA